MRHPCNNSLLVAALALFSLTEVHGKELIHFEKLIYELICATRQQETIQGFFRLEKFQKNKGIKVT